MEWVARTLASVSDLRQETGHPWCALLGCCRLLPGQGNAGDDPSVYLPIGLHMLLQLTWTLHSQDATCDLLWMVCWQCAWATQA